MRKKRELSPRKEKKKSWTKNKLIMQKRIIFNDRVKIIFMVSAKAKAKLTNDSKKLTQITCNV